jgi:hypothetical protein
MVAAIDCLVNQQRVRFGLPPLDPSPQLNLAAQNWTNYLVSTNQLFHGNPFVRMTAAGYDWGEGAEDLGGGYLTPRDMLAGWMGSAEHCQNLLTPDYRNFGAGENATGPGPAVWTMDLGLLVDQTPLSSRYGPATNCPYNVAPSPYGGSSGSPGSTGPTGPAGSTGSGWPSTPCDTPSESCPADSASAGVTGSPGAAG